MPLTLPRPASTRRRILRQPTRAVLSLVAAVCTAVVAVLPAAAVAPFAAPVVLFGSNCVYGTGAASSSVNGTARGAQTCNGENDGRIWIYWNQGTAKSVVGSPWTGQVVAVSWDYQNQLYVLFRTGSTLKIGKVNDAGAFSALTTLSTSLALYTTGSLVARNGKWWAVWSEAVGGQQELFQARTLLGSQAKTRITNNPVEDLEPQLSYAAGKVGLAWSRYKADFSQSDVWFATSTGGAFTSKPIATAGTYNNLPSLASQGSAFYVAWSQDGVMQVRDNASGAFKGRSFAVRGHLSRLAVSENRVLLVWETEEPVRIYAAERVGSTWTGAMITGGNVGLIGATSGNGQGTIVHFSTSGVVSRSQ